MPYPCVIALFCISGCAAAQGWVYVPGGTFSQLSTSDPCYGSTTPFPTCYSSRPGFLPMQFAVPRDNSGDALTGRILDASCFRPGGPTPASYYVDRYPQQRLDAPVSTMKGIQFIAQFNSGPVAGSGDALEAMYFHESACFYGGREYGFFAHAGSSDVYAYWAANANCPAPGDFFRCIVFTDTNCDGTCSNLPGPPNGVVRLGSFGGDSHAFQMVPVPLGPSGCAFQISVWDSAGRLVYDAPAPIDRETTAIDPFFCDAKLGVFNESGYLTVGTVYNIPTYDSLGSGNVLSVSQAAWIPNVHLNPYPAIPLQSRGQTKR